MDGSGEFFFLEMNARLQVEHPVTEFVYGIDLVAQQLAVANGEELSSDDDAMPAEPRGWAIECRINGEDPYQGFMPSLGLVEHVEVPLGPGTRFDSLLFDGLDLPIFYDSLLGKLIVWAESRPDAIARMRRALDDLVVAGVQTNAPFHSALLDHPDFISGDIHTSWVESTFEMPSLPTDDPRKTQSLIAAALSADLIDQERPATGQSSPGTGWRRTARATAVNTGSQDGGLRGWRRGTAS
jgi:acetyl-CoA carboxylase biotin carboxylase subunit